MSTHDWWLQLTRYQPRYGSSATPRTSHCVRWVRRIQPLLQAIQAVAMALSTGSMALRTTANGSTSLTSASVSSSAHQNSVLITSSVRAMTPRTTGAELSMVWSRVRGAKQPRLWPFQGFARCSGRQGGHRSLPMPQRSKTPLLQ